MNGGSLLEQDTAPYGTMPAYYGSVPVKPDEGYYTYSFAGWTPEVAAVEGDAVYSAVFDAATVSFELRFRSNGGLGAMDSSTVLRGLSAVLPDSGFTPPSKKVFDAWEIGGVRYAPGNVYTVGADTDVTALWKDLHTVTWINYDGTVLGTAEVPEGDVPVYTGALPVRPDDAEHIHTFAGWSPAPVPAAGAATYTAQYDEAPQVYTVTWKNPDGTVLETDADAPFGSMPRYDGDTPVQPATSDIVYGFSGWSPEIVPVTGDAVYTAQFVIDNASDGTMVLLHDSHQSTADSLDKMIAGLKEKGYTFVTVSELLEARSASMGLTVDKALSLGWKQELLEEAYPGGPVYGVRYAYSSGKMMFEKRS